MPKEHFADLYELSDEAASKALVLAKKIAAKLTEILKCDGFNIVQNNGTCAWADRISFSYPFDSTV